MFCLFLILALYSTPKAFSVVPWGVFWWSDLRDASLSVFALLLFSAFLWLDEHRAHFWVSIILFLFWVVWAYLLPRP